MVVNRAWPIIVFNADINTLAWFRWLNRWNFSKRLAALNIIVRICNRLAILVTCNFTVVWIIILLRRILSFMGWRRVDRWLVLTSNRVWSFGSKSTTWIILWESVLWSSFPILLVVFQWVIEFTLLFIKISFWLWSSTWVRCFLYAVFVRAWWRWSLSTGSSCSRLIFFVFIFTTIIEPSSSLVCHVIIAWACLIFEIRNILL